MFLGVKLVMFLVVETIAVTHDYVSAVIALPFVIMSVMDVFSAIKAYRAA